MFYLKLLFIEVKLFFINFIKIKNLSYFIIKRQKYIHAINNA